MTWRRRRLDSGHDGGRCRLLRRHPVQRRVLVEDPSFQVTQVRAGLDAKLLHQRAPGLPVGAQGVGLAARPVQGEHKLLMKSLPQRHLSDQLGELAERVAVAAESKQQVETAFRRQPPQLLQPGGLAAGELHVRHVLQRVAPPQRQGALDLIQRAVQLGLGTNRTQR